MWTAQRLEFEGGDVQLFCRGDGRPTPKVTWYDQEGNVIRTGKQYRVGITYIMLYVSKCMSMKWNHSGIQLWGL